MPADLLRWRCHGQATGVGLLLQSALKISKKVPLFSEIWLKVFFFLNLCQNVAVPYRGVGQGSDKNFPQKRSLLGNQTTT